MADPLKATRAATASRISSRVRGAKIADELSIASATEVRKDWQSSAVQFCIWAAALMIAVRMSNENDPLRERKARARRDVSLLSNEPSGLSSCGGSNFWVEEGSRRNRTATSSAEPSGHLMPTVRASDFESSESCVPVLSPAALTAHIQ